MKRKITKSQADYREWQRLSRKLRRWEKQPLDSDKFTLTEREDRRYFRLLAIYG